MKSILMLKDLINLDMESHLKDGLIEVLKEVELMREELELLKANNKKVLDIIKNVKTLSEVNK